MIDHPFTPHEVWTTRDQCEHRLDEEKDGAYGICAAPRSEHMDEVRLLKVQLATALRERDEWKRAAECASHNFSHDRKRAEKAESERNDLRAAVANANNQTADLNALRLKQDEELVSTRDALAAARRDVALLQAALVAALGAPATAAGEEGT